MRLRNACLGGTTVFAAGVAAGVAIGLTLAGGSSHRAAASSSVPSSSITSNPVPDDSAPDDSAPNTPVAAAPTPASPSGPGDARVGITAAPDGGAEGVVVIDVPPAEPERCSPTHITVDVGQSTLATCRSANYDGPMTVSVDNPAIASVSTSTGRTLPRYLYVIGLQVGTTIVRVTFPNGPTTTYPITVARADTSGG